VVEGVLGPFDAARQPLVQRHGRPDRLEVDEGLGVDVGEARRAPLLDEVAGRDGRRLPAVVPAPERRDHHRPAERGQLIDAEVV
jgi:hypothetical protein